EDFIAMANDEGITLPILVPFGQGYKDMSPAIEHFEEMLLIRRITHANHPILNWCVSNAVITADDAGNRKLSKDKAIGRIDLMICAVMAAGLHAGAIAQEKSFWE